MFQATSRYLPSAAATAAAAAAAGKRGKAELIAAKENVSAKASAAKATGVRVVQGMQLKYELPDTSFLSLMGTSFNLLNGTTGPGLLALPLAFSRTGWLLGSVLLILVFALNHSSLQLLLKACLTTREHSYIGLSMRAGPSVAALVDWSSLAFFFGSCVSYLVIIGDAFGQFTSSWGETSFYVPSAGGQHYATLALLMLCAFTGCVLAPLSLLKSMDSLQVTSGIAMLCILYAVSVILLAPDAHPVDFAMDPILDVVKKHRHHLFKHGAAPPPPPPPPPPAPNQPPPLGSFGAGAGVHAVELSASSLLSLPTMAFCFASQSLFPPALETLHQPATYQHMNTVVDTTMYATLALHLAVALAGYMRYGDAVTPNILDTLPPTSAVSLARAAVVLAFAFTYPMMIFLCRMHIQFVGGGSPYLTRFGEVGEVGEVERLDRARSGPTRRGHCAAGRSSLGSGPAAARCPPASSHTSPPLCREAPSCPPTRRGRRSSRTTRGSQWCWSAARCSPPWPSPTLTRSSRCSAAPPPSCSPSSRRRYSGTASAATCTRGTTRRNSWSRRCTPRSRLANSLGEVVL